MLFSIFAIVIIIFVVIITTFYKNFLFSLYQKVTFVSKVIEGRLIILWSSSPTETFKPVDTIHSLSSRFERFQCKVKTNNQTLCLDRTYIGLRGVHCIDGYSSFLPRSNTKIRTVKACCILEKTPIFDFWNGCFKQAQEASVVSPQNYGTGLPNRIWFYREISREICIHRKQRLT